MRHLSFLLALLTIGATFQLAQAEPTLIFPAQEKHVHSSSIVECPNGDYLAVWFHGSGERKSNDVRIRGARLKKGATAWGPVFEMADTPDLPDCNPVLYIDAQEKLWMFWLVIHTNRWERSILKYRTSTDYQGDGAPDWSWQDIILLKPGEGFAEAMKTGFKELNYPEPMWAEYAAPYTEMLVENSKDPIKRDIGWMTRTAVVTLTSGRILLPLYSDGYNVSLVAYSDDQGETWATSAPIVGLGNIQPAVVERKDGTLKAYMRDNGVDPRRIIEATSTDQGETWSIGTDMDFPNPGASVTTTSLKEGRWVMVYNDAEDGRYNLAIALSEDEGKTWPHRKTLESSPDRKHSFSYPTVMEGSDGNIHLSYSYRGPEGASIKYNTFSVDWIKQ